MKKNPNQETRNTQNPNYERGISATMKSRTHGNFPIFQLKEMKSESLQKLKAPKSKKRNKHHPIKIQQIKPTKKNHQVEQQTLPTKETSTITKTQILFHLIMEDFQIDKKKKAKINNQ